MKMDKIAITNFIKKRISTLEELYNSYLEEIKNIIEQKYVITGITDKITGHCDCLKSLDVRINELTNLLYAINIGSFDNANKKS